jgi:hypothetical protein
MHLIPKHKSIDTNISEFNIQKSNIEHKLEDTQNILVNII